MAQSLEIIRNRIDQFGVSEPVLVKQGKDEIVVQLPGVKDPERALELIGRTAQLQFKLVDPEARVDLAGLIDQAIASGHLRKNFSHQELNSALKGMIPPDDEVYFERKVDRESGQVTMVPLLLKKRTLMTGSMLKTAVVEITGPYTRFVIFLIASRSSHLPL